MGLVVASAAVAVLVVTALIAGAQPPLPGEAAAFEAVNRLPGWLEPPVVAVMQLGWIGLVPLVALVAAALTRSIRLGAAVAAAGVCSWWLANQGKGLLERPRPSTDAVHLVPRHHAEGFGYPSGHAAIAAAMATVVVLALGRRWWWVAIAAAAVGLGRLYVGVHYPLDVVGGAALGTAVGAVAGALLRYDGGGAHRRSRRPSRRPSRRRFPP